MHSVSTLAPHEPPARHAALWVGGLAGPFAWFTQLVGAYALTQWACSSHGRLALHIVSTLCLLWVSAGCFVAWNEWGAIGRQWPSHDDKLIVGRVRFMGAVAVLAGLLFAWIICAQWIAIVLLEPCPP